jgi:5-formyltetrahydrofolate cyclo-ligase
MPSERHGILGSSDEDALRRRVKAELRKRLRALRKTLPLAACRDRSARIVGRLAELEPVTRARSVALFWPLEDRHEVDLRALDATLRERGARVAYPAVDGDDGATLSFRFVGSLDDMIEGAFGVREPSPAELTAAPGELDVIIVPALALDPRGHRIGYGKGFYDRTLGAFAPPAVTVGVVYDFQLLAEVPETAGDVPVDHVVTDARHLAQVP